MRATIDSLVDKVPGAQALGLEDSGWLDQVPVGELPTLYQRYKDRFAEHRRRVEEVLGPPIRQLPDDRTWFDAWYPEAFAAAFWPVRNTYVCLVAEHQDREAPICILLRAVSSAEIRELANGPIDL